jgi:hypothetical protein
MYWTLNMKKVIGFLFGTLAASSIALAQPQQAVEATAPNGAVVTLLATKGICQGNAMEAVWQAPDKKTVVKGCWKTEDGTVINVSWLDGDNSTIPAQVFKPKASI